MLFLSSDLVRRVVSYNLIVLFAEDTGGSNGGIVVSGAAMECFGDPDPPGVAGPLWAVHLLEGLR